MAKLSEESRSEVWQTWMQEVSTAGEGATLTKTDVRAAVNGIDDWYDTNGVALNTAIPQPARTQMSQAQKSRMLHLVTKQRFEDGM